MRKFWFLLVLFLAMGASYGWAVCGPVDTWIDETAASEFYPEKAGGMLLRGLHRIIESPIEIGYHTYKGASDEIGAGPGVLKGLVMGVVWMADDIIRGGWDIVTFAFPGYHGEPGEHDLGTEIHG